VFSAWSSQRTRPQTPGGFSVSRRIFPITEHTKKNKQFSFFHGPRRPRGVALFPLPPLRRRGLSVSIHVLAGRINALRKKNNCRNMVLQLFSDWKNSCHYFFSPHPTLPTLPIAPTPPTGFTLPPPSDAGGLFDCPGAVAPQTPGGLSACQGRRPSNAGGLSVVFRPPPCPDKARLLQYKPAYPCDTSVTWGLAMGFPPLTPNGTASRRPLGQGAAPSQTLLRQGRATRPCTPPGGGIWRWHEIKVVELSGDP
jgi:hypothetical protein